MKRDEAYPIRSLFLGLVLLILVAIANDCRHDFTHPGGRHIPMSDSVEP